MCILDPRGSYPAALEKEWTLGMEAALQKLVPGPSPPGLRLALPNSLEGLGPGLSCTCVIFTPLNCDSRLKRQNGTGGSEIFLFLFFFFSFSRFK